MENKKGPYWDDVERSRIYTIALIYGKAADKLAPWDAAEAEVCYQKKIDLLTPLAPVSFGLAETLRKLANVQDVQGKKEQVELTLKHYNDMQQKLKEIEAEVKREHPELEGPLNKHFNKHFNKIFENLNLPNKEHDIQLAIQYKKALNSIKYPFDQIPQLADFFDKRGICLCVGNPTGGILITGINPSRSQSKKQDIVYTFKKATVEEKRLEGKIRNPTWRHLYEVLGEKLIEEESAYIDLFPLGFTNQNDFEDLIENNINFRANIVSITQREIETYIQPVLIIVANKQSSYYWGYDKKSTWMGYDMTRMRDDMELYQITGFKNNPDRLNPNIHTSSLCGSLILFYGLKDERHKDKLLTEEDIIKLYDFAKIKKKEWKV